MIKFVSIHHFDGCDTINSYETRSEYDAVLGISLPAMSTIEGWATRSRPPNQSQICSSETHLYTSVTTLRMILMDYDNFVVVSRPRGFYDTVSVY
jgi:hypothetical protein